MDNGRLRCICGMSYVGSTGVHNGMGGWFCSHTCRRTPLWAGPARLVAYLPEGCNTWQVRRSGQGSAEVADAYGGTLDLPTPLGAEERPEMVLEALRSRNPDKEVLVEVDLDGLGHPGEEIRGDCQRGLSVPMLVGTNGRWGDEAVRLWQVAGVAVADTNGGAIWEDADPAGYADLARQCGHVEVA